MKRATVHDVAAEARVSLATVDRVLNERPGVKSTTIERVHAAVEKIGFTRDQHAANLAKRREYRICFLLPAGDSAFMQQLREEVETSIPLERQHRTFIKARDILPFNGASLVEALDAISAEEFTGVVFIATDAPQVKQAIKRLADRGVIPITLVSDIPSSARTHFVGIDNTAAGRTAGSLLGRFVSPAKGKVAVIVGSMLLRDHVDRRLGFEQVIRTEFPGITLVPTMESNDDFVVAEKIVDDLLDEHPDLLGIYNIGAAKQGLVSSLKKHKRDGKVHIVAHDLTDDSKEALRDGVFGAIIHQDPPHQVRSAIRLVRAYADGRSFQESQERIRIDIFLRDNMPD